MGQACSDVQQRGDRSSPDSRDARLPRGRSKSGRRLRAPERRSLGCMSDVAKTIEAVWKIESTRLIAAIARVTHDIGIAEELAQDALVTALEVWPEEGIPDNPGAWLMKAAKRRGIDSLRRGRMFVQKHEEIARELEWQQQQLADALEHSLDQVIDDDILRLIFTACHPVLTVEARIALTLRLIGGLTTAEIARAFLVPEKTLGQRISRAKKTLSEAHVPFETPSGDELRRRVESVLMVVYLIFNEGYTATSGDEWMRAALSEEAPPRAHAGATSPRRIGSSCTCGIDGVAGIAQRSAPGQKRRGRLIAGSGPLVVGLRADPARNDRARTSAKTRRWRETLRVAGSHCRMSHARPHRRRDRLGRHRSSLRRLAANQSISIVALNR